MMLTQRQLELRETILLLEHYIMEAKVELQSLYEDWEKTQKGYDETSERPSTTPD